MNEDELIGIIELGNLDLKCLIFKANKENIEIVSSSVTPSDGFYNDVVINLTKATNAIRSCISIAEKKAKREAKEGPKKSDKSEQTLDTSKPITLDFITNPDK